MAAQTNPSNPAVRPPLADAGVMHDVPVTGLQAGSQIVTADGLATITRVQHGRRKSSGARVVRLTTDTFPMPITLPATSTIATPADHLF